MEKRYVTRGVAAEVPPWLQNLMWYLRESMQVERRDYLQVFRLSRSGGLQCIEHTQEQPDYKKILCVPAADAINAKVYIIEDSDHATMLLANEY